MSDAPSSWPDLLDALEERNRRCALAVAGSGQVPPDLPLRADGPLPDVLRLRAEAVLLETRRLAVLAERRLGHARLAVHYGSA